MCLMAVIREEPSYGYEMAHKPTERGLEEKIRQKMEELKKRK